MLLRNEGAIELSDSIKNNKFLFKLDISANDLTSKCANKLFQAITNS